jgi:transposase
LIALRGDLKIWLCIQPTDMRRSYDGLSAQVKRELHDNPQDGSLFVFINRRRTQMKCLYYESGGYCLWSKRLEQGQFAVPSRSTDAKKSLSQTEFISLIEGLDLVIKRHRKRYKKAE